MTPINWSGQRNGG